MSGHTSSAMMASPANAHVVGLGGLRPPPTLYGRTEPWAEVLSAFSATPALLGRDLGLTVRDGDEPLLALFGALAPEEVELLAGLPAHLADVWGRLRVVDHATVERDAAHLAEQLRGVLGADGIGRATFAAVPRGGAFVLAALAYLLDLRGDQLHVGVPTGPPADGGALTDGPLVLVDDCAISGLRIQEVLDALPDAHVVVALLYAHRDLRSAISARNGNVTSCLAGADLADHAPDRLGEGHAAWLERWESRGHGLWSGLPDYLCLPWNEPDSVVWSDAHQRSAATWRVVPPAMCLKNRVDPARRPRVSVHGDVVGALALGDGVVFAGVDDAVLIAAAGTGTATRLEGVAADMWRAAASAHDLGRAAASVADRYDVDEARVAADLHALVDDLRGRGILAA